MSIEDIAEWIRGEYSPDGVEVGSLGTRSLTLNIPAELGLTETCAALWNRFGATCELRQSSATNETTIIVWLPKNGAGFGTPRHPEDESRDFAPPLCQTSRHGQIWTLLTSIFFTLFTIFVANALHGAFSRFRPPTPPYENATAADWIKAVVDAF